LKINSPLRSSKKYMPLSLVITALLILMTCVLIHDGYSQLHAFLIVLGAIAILLLLIFIVGVLIERDRTELIRMFKAEIGACLKELATLWHSITTRK
jgi:VIT1/CCC1 family predicted Fe2+/Mn2+ transporter